MKKCLFSSVSISILLLISASSLMGSETNMIRIIKKGALLKLLPDQNSETIIELPIGAVLEYESLQFGWFKVIMPPNENKLNIVGYVDSSFVETTMQESNKQQERKIETAVANQDPYFLWKMELTKANNLMNRGVPVLILGIAFLAPSLYFIIRGPGEGMYYYTWAQLLMGAGVFAGSACLLFGALDSSRGFALVRELREEGIKKGYIKAGLLPEYRAIGVLVAYSF